METALRRRRAVIGASLVLAGAAAVYGRHLELDALPDVTGNLVVVLTSAPGFSPEEIERRVTRPVEIALGGIPGAVEQRSLSRYGISSVTVVFDDAVEPLRARQWVQERLDTVGGELPEGVEAPALGPVTSGLGEVFHFTLGSPRRTPAELYELAEQQVAPRLRSVPGVVEVNTWGGARRTLDVVLDPVMAASRGVSFDAVAEALEGAVGARAGASLARGDGHVFLRSVARPVEPAELGDRMVRGAEGRAVRLADVARVAVGALPRVGAATRDGRGETVYVMVQMLSGANALEVTERLRDRMDGLRAALPEDLEVDLVYDRAALVRATLRTVFTNLVEGGVLVIGVLFFLLGSLRAGLIVALTIPLSMLGAVAGMVFFEVPGNLMSLGAIDFGLLVDGSVVMVEGIFHAAHDPLEPGDFHARLERAMRRVARPVFYSVLIILLVYVPILSLSGVDGKMFRPMAITVILALAVSLALGLSLVPALARATLRPDDVPERDPRLVALAARAYRPLLAHAVRHPRGVAAGALALLAVGLVSFASAGSAFVPQLDEGDLVVQTTRDPEVSIETAVRRARRMESILLGAFPEVEQVVSRIGSPAVATDIMGLEQADVFVRLAPRARWRPGLDKPGLVAAMEAELARLDPGSEAGFTQPIQMRFNELIGGETSDVALSIFGPELDVLRREADRLQALLSGIDGADDVRVTAPPSLPLLEVRPDPLAVAQHGLSVDGVMRAVAAVRAGVELGRSYDGPTALPVRLRLGEPPAADGLAHVGLPTAAGHLVPLSAVAELRTIETPALVSHRDGERRLVVGFNVRGRSLGEVVAEARARIAGGPKLAAGYRLEWGGQLATMEAAQRRMAVVVPVALISILLILIWIFHAVRPALLILLNVPFAGVGGMLALTARGLPVSISAAIGFIALSGIAVLNGVVLMSRILEQEAAGLPPPAAAVSAAQARMRPVLMTALVAALGFLPMMLSTGVGAEVQRPLATVVIGGLVTSTLLTLLILPATYGWLAGGRSPRARAAGRG